MSVWSRVAALLFVVFAAGTSACGPSCAEVRARFRSMSAGPARAPGAHLRIELPYRILNRLAARALERERIEIDLPVLKLGSIPLPRLRARVRKVVFTPAGAGRVRATAVVGIRDRLATWAVVRAQVALEPVVRRRNGRAVLELRARPGDYAEVRPMIGDSELPEMAERLARVLGRALVARIPRSVLDSAAARLSRHILGDGWRALREPLFRRIGEHVLWKVQLPDVPIAGVRVESRLDRDGAEALRVDIETTLPVSRGLGEPVPADAGGAETIEVRAPAETAMALANWAIDRGHLPREYDRALHPEPGGAFRPLFAWRRGHRERPLVIHVFRCRSGCAYLRVGVSPSLDLGDERLVMRLRERRIEEVHGSAGLKLGAELSNLLSQGADRTRSAVSAMAVEVGRDRYRVQVEGASLDDSELRLRLRVAPARR